MARRQRQRGFVVFVVIKYPHFTWFDDLGPLHRVREATLDRREIDFVAGYELVDIEKRCTVRGAMARD